MKQQGIGSAATTGSNPGAPIGMPIGRRIGGLAGWLLNKMRVARRSEPRLAVLERIALAPRQSLALVEAEGRRFLVATSPEGTPAFYALDEQMMNDRARKPAARVSW